MSEQSQQPSEKAPRSKKIKITVPLVVVVTEKPNGEMDVQITVQHSTIEILD